jgi:hypothetical protein
MRWIQFVPETPILHNNVCNISKAKFRNQDVVVKEFVSDISPRDSKKIRQEVKNVISLKHENVVCFGGILPQRCAIVMEHIEKRFIVDNEEIIVHDVYLPIVHCWDGCPSTNKLKSR